MPDKASHTGIPFLSISKGIPKNGSNSSTAYAENREGGCARLKIRDDLKNWASTNFAKRAEEKLDRQIQPKK